MNGKSTRSLSVNAKLKGRSPRGGLRGSGTALQVQSAGEVFTCIVQGLLQFLAKEK